MRKGLGARSWNAENAQGKFDVVVGTCSVFIAKLHGERTKRITERDRAGLASE
jgi:hypothetical protein